MASLYIAAQRHLARGDYRPLGIPRFKGVPPLKYPAQWLPPLEPAARGRAALAPCPTVRRLDARSWQTANGERAGPVRPCSLPPARLPMPMATPSPSKKHEAKNTYHSRQTVINCHYENGNR